MVNNTFKSILSFVLTLGSFLITAQDAPPSDSVFRLQNVATGKFLTDAGESATAVTMSDSGEATNTHFRFVQSGSYYNIDSEVLGILRAPGAGGPGGAYVVVSTTKASPANDTDKTWTIYHDETNDTYRFGSRTTGRFLYHEENGTVTHAVAEDTDDRSNWMLIAYVQAPVVVASDEDTSTDLNCPSSGEFQNNNTRNVDISNPVNVGTADDRSCYSDYSESSVNGTTWGVYNITEESNHLDTPRPDGSKLQPRIERSLPRSQETGVGSYARFTGTFRILEVGDGGSFSQDGSYLAQAKGKHSGGGGSNDPAILLYRAHPVYGDGVNAGKQVAFDIYAERILERGGEGSGRETVFLKRVNKNEEVDFVLEVGFRQDPNDISKKIHYCDAIIGGEAFNYNIPEPERGLESGIRYGAYRVKGGRAQFRWANTTYQKVEVVDNRYTGTVFGGGSAPATSSTAGTAITVQFEDFDDGLNTSTAGALAATKNGSYRDTTTGNSGDNTTHRTTDADLKDNGTGIAITNIAGNEWMAYTVNFAELGNYHMNLNYAHGASGGKRAFIYLFETDDFDATPFKTVQLFQGDNILPSTGGSTSFENSPDTDSFKISTTGNYVVVIEFGDGGPNYDFFTITYDGLDPTMTSTKNGDWNDPSVWSVSGVAANTPSTTPTSEYDIVISHNLEIPTSMGAAEAKSITIDANKDLDLKENNTLTVTNDITLGESDNGMIIYNQNGSFPTVIFGGNYTSGKKTTIVKRLEDDKWTLVSSGLSNSKYSETFGDLRNKTVFEDPKYAFGSYNTSNDTYTYLATGYNTGGVWGSGKGWATKSNYAGESDVVFMGDLHDADVTIGISNGGNGYNLVGNPYPTYLYGNSTADNTNNFLTVNSSLIDGTIWLWNSNTSAWITKNQSDGAYHINPLQGFFVKATSDGNLSFTEAMQTHTSNSDNFLKTTNSRFEIDLSIASGKLNRTTSIRYIDGKTTSFDNGYDSNIFGGYSSKLEVYTGLVSDDSGEKLAIQSLPNENYEDMVIPVGVTAEVDAEITFTAEALNVPSGYKVYLEDRLNNTFTRLDEATSEYTTAVSETSTDGRFYIHAKSSALSADTELLNSVSIYKSNATTLRIVGLSQGKASVKIYNVLGKQVMSSNFNATGVKELNLPNLSKGVYIVQLETETGTLNKKIVLE